MQSIDELYSIFALYHSIPDASNLLGKSESYLKSCILKSFPNSNLFNLDNGLKNLSPLEIIKLSLNPDDYSAKFIEALGQHLLLLEDEVSEVQTTDNLSQISIRKKERKRKYNFNLMSHKKSILSSHMHGENYVHPVNELHQNISYNKIFKRISKFKPH